jgi:hypothetical protein
MARTGTMTDDPLLSLPHILGEGKGGGVRLQH